VKCTNQKKLKAICAFGIKLGHTFAIQTHLKFTKPKTERSHHLFPNNILCDSPEATIAIVFVYKRHFVGQVCEQCAWAMIND
jgi:hypothetical protein